MEYSYCDFVHELFKQIVSSNFVQIPKVCRLHCIENVFVFEICDN